jgi:hypothetical protein
MSRFARFGIEPHEAPVSEFPKHSSIIEADIPAAPQYEFQD